MFFWFALSGLVAVLDVITVVENRRGSKGSARDHDRHLNAPDLRGTKGWDAGGGG